MAQKLAFNAKQVSKAGSQEGKRTTYAIEGVRGLILDVTPNGTGTFYFRYKAKLTEQDGSKKWAQRKIKLGRRGELDLAEAREKAEELQREVRDADNADLAELKRDQQKTKAKSTTFEQMFKARMKKDARRSERTLADYEKALNHDEVFEKLSGPANDITGVQVANILQGIEDRSVHAAHKVRSAIGSTYRWGRRQGLVTIDPTAGLGFTVQSTPRVLTVTNQQLRAFWLALDEYVGQCISEDMARMLKLATLTAQRAGMIAGAMKSELVDLEGERPRWQISGDRMKAGRDQVVPLSDEAVIVVKEALKASKSISPYLFPGEGDSGHVRADSISQAMGRLRERAGLVDLRAHDLRKVCVTWLREEAMVSEDIAAAVLAHSKRSVTGKHYDFASLERPVRAALQAWADHVMSVVQGAGNKDDGSVNVVKLRA